MINLPNCIMYRSTIGLMSLCIILSGLVRSLVPQHTNVYQTYTLNKYLFLLFFCSNLSVVDIYQEWCGPCKAMVSGFRRLKNELGDDLLKFAVVST